MSYEFYKILHILGITLIILPLGGLLIHALGGGVKSNLPSRKMIFITHGVGLLIAFVAGFGLMARTGTQFSDGWIWVKLGIWLFLAGVVSLIFRKKSLLPVLWILIPLIVGLGAFLARYKPF